MEQNLRFHLLGTFTVLHSGNPVRMGGATAQAVLVALLQHAGEVRQVDDLIAAVWGTPRAIEPDGMYHYVSGLRRALAATGVTITSCRPGYRLDVPDTCIDAAQFSDLVTTARALRDTDPDQAIARLRQALALWRGSVALANLTLPGTRRLAAALDARRLDAEEDLATLELDRGRPDQVLDRLRDLAGDHPERGGLQAVLMHALHTTGRTDEALQIYQDAYRHAHDQGRDLDPRLRHAQQDVLRGHHPSPPSRSATVPFQLPPDTAHFTGRTDELASLLALRSDSDRPAPQSPLVSVIEGMAGIGKTSLALHAAHQLADRFPDGVLFLDLRGFTPGADPTPPDAALDTLLRGLGVPGQNIPLDFDGRVALYRTELSQRRVLVVLDNAATESQIRPLLPASPGCLVLVTSRRHLAGLVAAVHLTLDPLPETDAVTLFRRIVTDRAGGGDERAIEQVVALCGYLPLAVRIAATRLKTTRAMTPTILHTELHDELKNKMRLDGLADGERAVAAALTVSYRSLTVGQRDTFRLLCLHPGTDLDPYAVAALSGGTIDYAHRLLDDLERVSLVDQPVFRRYALHDLVRIHAIQTATRGFTAAGRAALTRLFDYYVFTAAAAIDVVDPYEAERSPRGRASGSPVPDLDEPRAAEAWLGSELDNLLATAAHAAANGWPNHTLHLSTILGRHLRTRARYAEAEALHQHALVIARDSGDHVGERDALTSLGEVHRMRSRHEAATDCFERALTIAADTGDRIGEMKALYGLGEVHRLRGALERAIGCFEWALAIAGVDYPIGELGALNGLGNIHLMQGRHKQATDCFERALAIAGDTGDRVGEFCALWGLGGVQLIRGLHKEAAQHYERALAIARDTGYPVGELSAYNGLGNIHLMQGSCERAIDCYGRAFEISQDTGNVNGEVFALCGLGDVYLLQGWYKQAVDCFGRALHIGWVVGDRNGQLEARDGLGRCGRATGRLDRALAYHRIALDLATELGHIDGLACAHDGLAHVYQAQCRYSVAREHWQAALDVLTTCGVDYTHNPLVTTKTIRAHLDELDASRGE